MRTLSMVCGCVGLVTAMTTALACSRDVPRPDASSSTTTITAAEAPAGAPLQDPVAGSREARADYVRTAGADLDNLDARIDQLGRRADAVLDPGARAQIDDELRSARTRAKILRSRVSAVQTMSDDSWRTERPHLEADWQLLNDRLDRLAEKLADRPYTPAP